MSDTKRVSSTSIASLRTTCPCAGEPGGADRRRLRAGRQPRLPRRRRVPARQETGDHRHGVKNFSPTYRALGDDIKVDVERESLDERGLSEDDLMAVTHENDDEEDVSSIEIVDRCPHGRDHGGARRRPELEGREDVHVAHREQVALRARRSLPGVAHVLPGDAVLLIEDAVVGACAGRNRAGAALCAAMPGCTIAVLGPDLAARGIPAEAIVEGVAVVDYGGFVDLAIHDKVQAWL